MTHHKVMDELFLTFEKRCMSRPIIRPNLMTLIMLMDELLM